MSLVLLCKVNRKFHRGEKSPQHFPCTNQKVIELLLSKNFSWAYKYMPFAKRKCLAMASIYITTYRLAVRSDLTIDRLYLYRFLNVKTRTVRLEIMNDYGLEQLVHFPTREKNTLDLINTSLPGQFFYIHSPNRLSDHDIVSGTLKVVIPPIKKPKRKVYRYQKGDYESMRKDTLKFAKEKYFNGHSDTRSVQENFILITSFIQDSADKHIPSKTSRSVSSVP